MDNPVAPRMLIASGITLGFAILAFVLRMIVKYFIVHSTSWEDYLASAALLLAVGRTIIFILREYRTGFPVVRPRTVDY